MARIRSLEQRAGSAAKTSVRRRVTLPDLLRATVAKLPLRGVPRLLTGLTRRFGSGGPGLCRIDTGDWLDLDLEDADQCMMLYGLYSRSVSEVARRLLRPGDTAWDIGGQLGYFATRFARMVGEAGRVLTFEPDPRTYERLLRGLARTGHPQLDARPWAITARSGTASLRISPTVGWSSLVDFDEPTERTVQVPARAIDDLVECGELDPTGLRLIKLDIEGGELPALQGMRGTLAARPVAVVCEFNHAGLQAAGATAAELLSFFHDLGMATYAIRMPEGVFRSARPWLTRVREASDVPFALGDLLCLDARAELPLPLL